MKYRSNWYTNHTKNMKEVKYDGNICRIRGNWCHSVPVRYDDYELNQESKDTK